MIPSLAIGFFSGVFLLAVVLTITQLLKPMQTCDFYDHPPIVHNEKKCPFCAAIEAWKEERQQMGLDLAEARRERAEAQALVIGEEALA